ncbi:hypothetical protein DBZ36_19600 [Alginatibacterium sediminis]|uniref:Uncharacterized protein n=1 Tax=Alginatibacterium sediminis TaxID=2164068 RepID=A0A420E712_9ALTE|nr:hypothetical protein [Alginatibacterium sediminis]RKF13265.1 hypothetical protein DBZ36_19600 [Alginatibacterium sediminis]
MLNHRLVVLGSKASLPAACLEKIERMAGPVLWSQSLEHIDNNSLACASLILVDAHIADLESQLFETMCHNSDMLVVVYQCDRVKQAVQVMKLGASQAVPGDLCSSMIEQMLLKFLPSQS